jgi:hypothetical protein
MKTMRVLVMVASRFQEVTKSRQFGVVMHRSLEPALKLDDPKLDFSADARAEDKFPVCP